MSDSVPVALLTLALLGGPAQGTAVDGGEDVLLGSVTREEVASAHPEWMRSQVEAEVDREAAFELQLVPPGARVEIFFGSWCSDSRRELPRLWRALDEVGGMVPFEIEHVGVDEDKKEPEELVRSREIELVPTFVVTRDGREVGRVVETSPNGIEVDLLSLLTGETTGVITATEAAEEEPGPDR